MIKELILKNVQSHDDSRLQFHSGVNTIVGSSDKGKSAIFRGLLWNIKNKPDGTVLGSYWIKDDKEKLTGDMESTIVYDNGTVGRIRNGKKNVYTLNGAEQKAMKRGEVPSGVRDFQKFSEINIQNQHDPAFMFSMTSGKVAEALNKYVNMTVIDTSMSNINSKYKKEKQDRTYKEAEIEKLKEQITGLDFLDKVEARLGRIKLLDNKRQTIEADWLIMGDLIQELDEVENNIDDATSLVSLSDNLIALQESQKKLEELQERIDQINTTAETIDNLESDIEVCKMMVSYETVLKNLKTSNEKVEAISEETVVMENIIKEISECDTSIANLEKLSSLSTSVVSKRVDKLVVVTDKLDSIGDLLQDLTNTDTLIKRYKRMASAKKKEYDEICPDTCPVCGTDMK